MPSSKKLLQAAAGAAGGEALNIEDIFSTYLYNGTGSTNQTITNGIDLSGEGGLVWAKSRSASYNHFLVDTERGGSSALRSDGTAAASTYGQFLSFNSDGYEITRSDSEQNNSSHTYASWTFRKAPKFFDVVAYTGDGVSGRQISHNLGVKPACIMVKRTDTTGDWIVSHRSSSGIGLLNSAGAFETSGSSTPVTDGYPYVANSTTTTFYVAAGNGGQADVNASGGTYVAYLFAHNDGDGEFGPDGDADIIKCGSYNGAASGTPVYNKITLGFEPQWIMVKAVSGQYAGSAKWVILDAQRSGSGGREVYPNDTSAESTSDFPNQRVSYEADGFSFTDNYSYFNRSGHTYIYIAIRRGPMAVPEDATDVFATDVHGSAGDSVAPAFRSGWPVDMSIRRNIASTDDWDTGARLIQTKYIRTNSSTAETSESSERYDFMNGWWNSSAVNNNLYGWMWRRAPQFFDVVCHTGNGTNHHAIEHNLGVAPEMIWTKCRSSSKDWGTYVLGEEMFLNTTNSSGTDRGYSQTYDPTATHFYLGTVDTTNESGLTYISFLFTSLDGIAKVGTYTGNGSSLNVDCGFSSGARFVMVKRTDSAGGWAVFDTERGIVSGNDSLLQFNTNSSQFTTYDNIDPYSSGFTILNGVGATNVSGASYIFYAIA